LPLTFNLPWSSTSINWHSCKVICKSHLGSKRYRADTKYSRTMFYLKVWPWPWPDLCQAKGLHIVSSYLTFGQSFFVNPTRGWKDKERTQNTVIEWFILNCDLYLEQRLVKPRPCTSSHHTWHWCKVICKSHQDRFGPPFHGGDYELWKNMPFIFTVFLCIVTSHYSRVAKRSTATLCGDSAIKRSRISWRAFYGATMSFLSAYVHQSFDAVWNKVSAVNIYIQMFNVFRISPLY